MTWPLPERDEALLELAKTYPFPAPAGSYLFTHGQDQPIAAGTYDPVLFRGRVPVLAHGSNRSPAQLARKFGKDAQIPVTVGWLHDHDVVYSAHVTQYGAIASTLRQAPGSQTQISVTWLDPAQLRRMHETEGPSNYRYGRLAAIRMELEAGPEAAIGEAYLYLSTNGCLARAGSPLGLAAVAARGRPHGALSQEQVLTYVRDRYRPEADLDAMILRKIRDQALRQALVAEMRAEALPAAMPGFQVLPD